MSRYISTLFMAVFMLLLPQKSHSQDDEENVFVDPNQPKIDSLLNLVKDDLSDGRKTWIYYRIGFLTSNNDTCLKYAFLSLEYCDEGNPAFDGIRAAVYDNIGCAYYMKDESRKALQYYFMSAELYHKLSKKSMEAFQYNNIAGCYEDLNINDSVFYYYNLAVKMCTELQDTIKIVQTYIKMGRLYYNMSLYDQSEETYRNALNYAIKANYILGAADCYSRIGEVCMQLGETDNAIECLKKAANIQETSNSKEYIDIVNRHLTYTRLAETYIKEANTTGKNEYADSCYMYYKKTGSFFLSTGSYFDYILNQQSYIEYLIYYKRYSDALAESQKLDKYIADNSSIDILSSHTKLKYRIYLNLGDYKNALECYKTHMKYMMAQVNDSTLSIIKDAEVERAHMIDSINHSYETLRIESEHKLEMQRKQSEVYILLAVFIAILLVGVFAFRWYRTNKQKNELMLRHKALEIERTLLRSQMNPHFIFNAMNSIQHFISINETYEAERYLSKFAKLIRLVLDSSTKQAVALTEELQFLSLYLDLEQVRFAGKFTYKIDIDDNVEEDLIGVPPMLMQPFIENSIIHGLMHKENGEGLITIKVEEHDKDTLQCSIIDNGIGRKAAAEFNKLRDKSHKSIGMKLTRERLKDLNKPENVEKSYVVTDLEDENGNALGTKTTILMPIYDI